MLLDLQAFEFNKTGRLEHYLSASGFEVRLKGIGGILHAYLVRYLNAAERQDKAEGDE